MSSARQHVPRISWNTEVYYRINKIHVLSQTNSVRAPLFILSKVHFNIILLSLRSPPPEPHNMLYKFIMQHFICFSTADTDIDNRTKDEIHGTHYYYFSNGSQ